MKSLSIKLILVLVCIASIGKAQRTGIKLVSEDEIKASLQSVPCKDKERLDAARALFVAAGAPEDSISIDKHDKVENLVITKKGSTDEIVIIGAHYDKTDDGCGALDNWSGVVILSAIYQTVKDLNTKKTFLFVAFGKEEKGLIGSSAMAKNIPKENLMRYCAMVNFDSFGMTVPQALSNISDKKLIELAETVSGEMNIPFGKAGIDLASSDSASFRKRDIPAITLHGLGDKWQDYLHGPNDKLNNVNANSVFIGYRHGLVVLSKIENSECAAFRK